MAIESRITPRQQAVLDRFTCQRLTAEPENRGKARGFICLRNPHLADRLAEDAWREDQEGRPTVCYVVKNPQGQIAMYFSLKCGVLFDPDYVRDVMERYDRSKALMDALGRGDRQYLEELRAGAGMLPGRQEYEIRGKFARARSAKRDILKDEAKDPNRKLIRVDEAFPAVELVHFCVNDAVRGQWASYHMGHPMGECLFWQFVVPKMLEINRLIGCEYAYLFAADSTPDGTLMNYYETALHFRRMAHIGAIKPEYDFLCVFMGARLAGMTPYRRGSVEKKVYEGEDPQGLYDYREAFFENFNLASGEEPV